MKQHHTLTLQLATHMLTAAGYARLSFKVLVVGHAGYAARDQDHTSSRLTIIPSLPIATSKATATPAAGSGALV